MEDVDGVDNWKLADVDTNRIDKVQIVNKPLKI